MAYTAEFQACTYHLEKPLVACSKCCRESTISQAIPYWLGEEATFNTLLMTVDAQWWKSECN